MTNAKTGASRKIVLEHVMGGDDSPWLGRGFHPWEPETGTRWASGRCVILAELEPSAAPYVCEVRLTCWVPSAKTPGGMSVFVNGVLAARVDNVYQQMAQDKDDNLTFRFATFGGPARIELIYDAVWKPPDERDRRDLAMVLRRLRIISELA